MPSETLWTVMGTAAAALTATSFIPQLVIQWRHPDRARVAYGTLAAFLLGSALWTGYGLHLKDPIIVGANCFILLNLTALTVLQVVRDLRR
jgi:MtN3 and saliva related transmembrane protein